MQREEVLLLSAAEEAFAWSWEEGTLAIVPEVEFRRASSLHSKVCYDAKPAWEDQSREYRSKLECLGGSLLALVLENC